MLLVSSSEREDMFASLHALSGRVQSARKTIAIIGTAEAYCPLNRRGYRGECAGRESAGFRQDAHRSFLDRMRSIL